VAPKQELCRAVAW